MGNVNAMLRRSIEVLTEVVLWDRYKALPLKKKNRGLYSPTFTTTTNIHSRKTNYDIIEYFAVSLHCLLPQVAHISFLIVFSFFLRSIIKTGSGSFLTVSNQVDFGLPRLPQCSSGAVSKLFFAGAFVSNLIKWPSQFNRLCYIVFDYGSIL